MAAAFPNHLFCSSEDYGGVFRDTGKRSRSCVSAGRRIRPISEIHHRMKKQSPGTQYVPVFRSSDKPIANRLNSVLSYFLPEDCKITSKSDFYYASSIACLCATFLFPWFIVGAALCLYKAKKGGSK